MRKPSSRNATASRKRASSKRPHALNWFQPTLTPMLTTKQVAGLDAADARVSRKPPRPRLPQQCTVGYGYYATSTQPIPTLRLRGRWLEQLGFTIGSKLCIVIREGELVMTVAGDA